MILRGLRLYSMLLREWERIQGKDWFQRLPESSFELERKRPWILLSVVMALLRNQVPEQPPLKLKIITLDKPRELIEMPLESHLIHGCLRQMLEASIQANHSPFVHSFIRGRSVKTAFEQIRGRLKRYRKKTKQKNRALFVLRADIKKCGESIPVHPRSPLWSLLKPHLPDPKLWPIESFLTRSLRPDLEWKGTPGAFQLLYGIPTGSPLQPLMLNLYLSELDRYFEDELKKEPHALYCRYGDDFFFAHPDQARFEEIKAGFFAKVRELELETRPEKIQSFRWSGSGYQGRASVEFLGYELHFNGALRINRKKQALLLKHLKRIAKRTFEVLSDLPLEERITEVKKGLERAYGIKQADHARRGRHPYLDKVLSLANDRGQLLELDHEVLKIVAELASGQKGPRAFRRFRKRTLLQTHRIPSLVGYRNRKEEENS